MTFDIQSYFKRMSDLYIEKEWKQSYISSQLHGVIIN
jgi:hypothetical protein